MIELSELAVPCFVCLDEGCMETSSLGFVCEPCFNDSAVLHEHDTFVRVSAMGEHDVVTRPVGLATRRELTSAMDLPLDTGSEGGVCVVCLEHAEQLMRKTSI